MGRGTKTMFTSPSSIAKVVCFEMPALNLLPQTFLLVILQPAGVLHCHCSGKVNFKKCVCIYIYKLQNTKVEHKSKSYHHKKTHVYPSKSAALSKCHANLCSFAMMANFIWCPPLFPFTQLSGKDVSFQFRTKRGCHETWAQQIPTYYKQRQWTSQDITWDASSH